jgi:uncharacterized protein
MFRSVALALIRFYQKGISPFTLPSCRFTPTCSAYALEAIERYGAGRGGWLAARRLARCNPFGGKGYDPVPLPPGETRGRDEADAGTDRPQKAE